MQCLDGHISTYFNQDTCELFMLCIMLMCQLYRVDLLLLLVYYCCSLILFVVQLLFHSIHEVHTVGSERKTSLMKAKEGATCACRCRRVSIQKYSVRYKEYSQVGVTTVERGATRGTTALVY
jgi:hypothetical protein